MPHVARFSVTPVKGTALHHPMHVRFELHGAVGDRLFFFITSSGAGYSPNKLGPLMTILATHDAATERLAFRMPDGATIEGSAVASDAPCSIDLWGRFVHAHFVDGPWNDLASDLTGVPLRLARVDRPGEASDVAPVTLVSAASLIRLGDALDGLPVDASRFRMTIELDGVEAHEEDTWAERSVRVGDVELRVSTPVPRCLVTTWNPATGIRDLPTLKGIAAYRERTPDGLPFGMYATVLTPGRVSVNDEVELLD